MACPKPGNVFFRSCKIAFKRIASHVRRNFVKGKYIDEQKYVQQYNADEERAHADDMQHGKNIGPSFP